MKKLFLLSQTQISEDIPQSLQETVCMDQVQKNQEESLLLMAGKTEGETEVVFLHYF